MTKKFTMHRVCITDAEQETGAPSGIAIMHDDKYAYLLSGPDAVAEVIELLQSDSFSRMLDLTDERLNLPWLTISQASALAHELYPDQYLGDDISLSKHAHKFRQTARNNPAYIGAAKRTNQWVFQESQFRNYLKGAAAKLKKKQEKTAGNDNGS